MSTNTSPQVQPPRKRNRVSLCVFLLIQVIFLSWVVFSVSLPQPGVSFQMGLWTVTDVLLAAVFLAARAAGR